MKRILKILKKIMCVLSIIIIFVNFIIIVKSIVFPKQVPSIFGYKPYIVKSGSSQTDLHYGEFILVKKEKNINVNDIVVVKTSDKKATTYSVKNINKDMLKLEDESKDYVDLSKESIEGKVVYKNFFIGNLIEILKTPIVIIFSLIITTLIGIFIYKL